MFVDFFNPTLPDRPLPLRSILFDTDYFTSDTITLSWATFEKALFDLFADAHFGHGMLYKIPPELVVWFWF